MQERKMGNMKMRDMKIRDMNIRENEYAGQMYAKSNVYTMKLIKFKLTFKKHKCYHQNSSTVLQFSSVQFAKCQYKVKTIVMSAR